MAKKEATLTHKVRNPQDLSSWLDIWTATVSADFGENNARTNETIVITPSNNWQITADKLGTIPVTQIADTNDKHNVTISRPIESNVLTKTDGNGNLVAGPTISTSDEYASYFLNQKGQWAQINTSFTVDLETVTEDNQEKPTSNAEFKVGNNSVIVKPQGKLAFSDVSTNKNEIKLSLGPIETTDLDNNFKLPLENIEDLPINSAEVAGMVKKGNDKESPSVWLTTKQTLNGTSTDNYVPDWGQIQTGHIEDDAVTEGKIKNDAVTKDKIANGSVTGDKLSDTAITDKFDTKLLGAFISEEEPIKYNLYNINIVDTYTETFNIAAQLYNVEYVLRASPSANTTGASWMIQVFLNSELLTTFTDQRESSVTWNMNTPVEIFPMISYIFYDVRRNNDSPFFIETPQIESQTELETFLKGENLINNMRTSLNSHINYIDGTGIFEAVPNNERLYVKDFILENTLNEWDYKHLGIWVEI